MTHTILETIHGSHLYGMAHADSDRDFFKVVSGKGRTTHTQKWGVDITEMSLPVFLTHVFEGSHQSCEALFSPLAWIDPAYEPLFKSIRVTGPDVFAKYRRTIKRFSFGPLKMRRHAVRLGLNLCCLKAEGRFNPVLTHDQRAVVFDLAERYEGDELYRVAARVFEEE